MAWTKELILQVNSLKVTELRLFEFDFSLLPEEGGA